jgi:glutamate 5-kinase
MVRAAATRVWKAADVVRAPTAPAASRRQIAGARRVVVKVGSSSVASAGGGLDAESIDDLVDAVAAIVTAGRQVVLISSGAIAAGLAPLRRTGRPSDLATQQAAASVGQGLLLARYAAAFDRHGRAVGQVLLTAGDLVRRAHYRNAQRTLSRLLALGAVPVVNENDTVATDEIRYGDNDHLAALVAHLVQADALVLLSDVDGVYDADPSRPGARRLRVVGPGDLDGIPLGRAGRSGVGSGGMITKVEAARIAAGSGVPALVAAAADVGPALAGADVGTLFFPTTDRRPPARLLWLAHASAPAGRLRLDDGAVAAVRGGRASLLAAGVTGVDGRFTAGDAVDLVDPAGGVVARGLVGYDADELPGLLGRSTRELAAALGSSYEREVVHRDDLVLLSG